MTETQWAVEHFDANGMHLGIRARTTEAAAWAMVHDCNDRGAPCRVLRREVPDWSYADSEVSR